MGRVAFDVLATVPLRLIKFLMFCTHRNGVIFNPTVTVLHKYEYIYNVVAVIVTIIAYETLHIHKRNKT